jgi:hypothetical protein
MFHDVVEEVENCGRLPPGTCPATTARSISKRHRDARTKRGKINPIKFDVVHVV